MGAIAKGKVNASETQIGDRIIVKIHRNDAGLWTSTSPSRTKTGTDVLVARVTGKPKCIGRRGYIVQTTAGEFYAEPIQTMWLAPEDAAGIKRAHAEALAEDTERAAITPSPVEETEQTTNTAYFPGKDEGRSTDEFLASLDEPEEIEMTTETATPHRTGSAVVTMMERVWERIRQNHPDLPDMVIVTGSGHDTGGLKWGHFRAGGWTTRDGEGATTTAKMDEMFMAGETLAKGARQVLQTMLHEGAHTLARIRGVQDTSRQGRWHNMKFVGLAQEMGLEYRSSQADKSIGYSAVVLKDETTEEYADLLDELDKEISLVISLPVWLGGLTPVGEPQGGEGVKGRRPTEAPSVSNNLKLTCECETPNIIRASRKVAEKMVVNCGDCDALFLER